MLTMVASLIQITLCTGYHCYNLDDLGGHRAKLFSQIEKPAKHNCLVETKHAGQAQQCGTSGATPATCEDKTKTPCSMEVLQPAVSFPCSRDRLVPQKSRSDIQRTGVPDRLEDLNKTVKQFVVVTTSILTRLDHRLIQASA
jgi:hypothetical protein